MFFPPSTPATSSLDPAAEQLDREPIDQADARPDSSLRQFSLEMLSGTDLGNRYLTQARRAVFAIHYASGKPVAGWVRVSGRLKSNRPVYLSIYARHRRSADFAPVELSPVHLRLRAGRFEAIAFTDGLTTLRCDAPHGDAEFTIDRLSIRRIGWPGVAGWRLSRFLHRVRQRRIAPVGQLLRLSRLMCSRQGLRMLWALWLHPRADDSYEEWIELFDTLSPSDTAAIRRQVRQMTRKPKLSVVMPTYNTHGRWLRMAIEFVQAQLYDNWELCIADDGSTNRTVRRILTQYAQRDSRIKVVYARKNGGIAETTNLALGIADGEFVALLDHDDIIPPHALYMVAQAIAEHPCADLIYSDEDKIDRQGRRYDPYFKCEFNRELLYSHNMISHLGVYRLSKLRELGGLRKKYDGSQDYDLALRFVEHAAPGTILHIPHILYHWRAVPGSVAYNPTSKDYAHVAARSALQDHFNRIHLPARSLATHTGTLHRARIDRSRQPPVTIVIPTRDRVDLLQTCISSVLRITDYPRFNILVVDNESTDKRTLRYLRHLQHRRAIELTREPGPFNFAALNNRAARSANGELLCFLNNDTEVIDPDWLAEMVSHGLREDVGMVGAKLYKGTHAIQHAGIILVPDWLAWHAHEGLPAAHTGYFGRAILHQELSAVTAACCVIRRELFLRLGGFDSENFGIHYNDVDLCLRLREAGYRTIWTPFAELHHRGSATLGDMPDRDDILEREARKLRERWGQVLAQDPFFSPNLSTYRPDFALAFPPRTSKPWHVADDH